MFNEVRRLIGEGFRINFFPGGIYMLYWGKGNSYEIRQPEQQSEAETIDRLQYMEHQIKEALKQTQ